MPLKDVLIGFARDLEIDDVDDDVSDAFLVERLAGRIGLTPETRDGLTAALAGAPFSGDATALATEIYNCGCAANRDLDDSYESRLARCFSNQPPPPPPPPLPWEEAVAGILKSLPERTHMFHDCRHFRDESDEPLYAPFSRLALTHRPRSEHHERRVLAVPSPDAGRIVWEERARAANLLSKLCTRTPSVLLPTVENAATDTHPGWIIYARPKGLQPQYPTLREVADRGLGAAESFDLTTCIATALDLLNSNRIHVLYLSPDLIVRHGVQPLSLEYLDPCSVWHLHEELPESRQKDLPINGCGDGFIRAQNFLLAKFCLGLMTRFNLDELPDRRAIIGHPNTRRAGEHLSNFMRRSTPSRAKLERRADLLSACLHRNPENRPDTLQPWKDL